MVKALGLALLVSMGLQAAPMAPELPLLVHSYDEGLVPSYIYHRTSCEIWPSQVVIRRSYAGIETVQATPITMSADSLATLRQTILKAAQGKIEETSAPTDGPYDGYVVQAGNGLPAVTLKVNQSSQNLRNTAPEAQSLILLLDAHCGVINR